MKNKGIFPTHSMLNLLTYLYILGDALPLQKNFSEGSMCQQTLHGGLHEELNSFGHMSKTAQEKRGIFYSVVADGIDLHYKHVFGHHLRRKESVAVRPHSWTPFLFKIKGTGTRCIQGEFSQRAILARKKLKSSWPTHYSKQTCF